MTPGPFRGRPRHETGGTVMKQVLAACKAHGIEARRQNTGVGFYPNPDGTLRKVHYGNTGDPDISLILPGGRAGAIEAKATGTLPTIEQFRRILEINRAGGFAFWCDCVDLALQILPYAVPERRIAYTSIRQIVVAFQGEIVPGELTSWNGTEKQQRAERAKGKKSRSKRAG